MHAELTTLPVAWCTSPFLLLLLRTPSFVSKPFCISPCAKHSWFHLSSTQLSVPCQTSPCIGISNHSLYEIIPNWRCPCSDLRTCQSQDVNGLFQQLYSSIPTCCSGEVYRSPVVLLLSVGASGVWHGLWTVEGWYVCLNMTHSWEWSSTGTHWMHNPGERERKHKTKVKNCIWENCRNCSEVANDGNNWSLRFSVQPPCVLISSLHFHAFLLHPWSAYCVCPLSCQPDSPWWWVADPVNHRALKPFLIPSKHIPSLWMMQWASYISLSCLVTRLTLMTNAGWRFV